MEIHHYITVTFFLFKTSLDNKIYYFQASQHGSIEATRYLCKSGALKDEKNKKMQTAKDLGIINHFHYYILKNNI